MENCGRYDNLMWLSYARGLLDSNVAAGMKSHSDFCEECSAQLDFSQKIAGVIDLNSMVPPDDWISEAAVQFESSLPPQEPPLIFGEMVFDSFLHDQEAVRSNRSQIRHLIFDLPKLEVDLVLEYSGHEIKLLMGHLLPKTDDSTAAFQDLRLDLRVASHQYSGKPNKFGEFSFTVDTAITDEPLELRCASEEGQCLIVLIPC